MLTDLLKLELRILQNNDLYAFERKVRLEVDTKYLAIFLLRI